MMGGTCLWLSRLPWDSPSVRARCRALYRRRASQRTLSRAGGSLMAATPSSITGLATPTQRACKILTIVLAGLAVVVSMAWTPALLSISIALDPGRNSRDTIKNYSAAQLQAMIAQAKLQFSVIALICLIALVALVALAIVAG